MKNVGIKELRTSGYCPSTSGLTEQSNTTTKKYLTTFLDTHEQKNDWDLLLYFLYYVYSSSFHTRVVINEAI